MPKFDRERLIVADSNKLQKVVLGIELYPEFVPNCSGARIVELGEGFLVADLVVRFKIFSEQYRSKIYFGTTEEGNLYVNVEAISGPFKYLHNNWLFIDNKNGSTLVKFSIDFEFESFLFGKMMDSLFEKYAEKMINAFENRALSSL
jgi:coenzyme Q-binding protein COQ10